MHLPTPQVTAAALRSLLMAGFWLGSAEILPPGHKPNGLCTELNSVKAAFRGTQTRELSWNLAEPGDGFALYSCFSLVHFPDSP